MRGSELFFFTVWVSDMNVDKLDGEQKKSSTGINPIEDFD